MTRQWCGIQDIISRAALTGNYEVAAEWGDAGGTWTIDGTDSRQINGRHLGFLAYRADAGIVTQSAVGTAE